MAKSPNLRANSVNDQPEPGGVSGIDASNTISSLERRCRQVGLEKIARRNFAFGCQVPNRDETIQGEEHGRQLRRWIGVGQATAQRAAIAYLLIADISQRLGKQRAAFSDKRIIQQTGLSRQAADFEHALLAPDVVHPVNEVDINDMGRLSQPKIH